MWEQADQIWEELQNEDDFASYASSNYEVLYQTLCELKTKATTFLECGSGLGVATIMASHVGFEAYGIEAKPSLVDFSRKFNDQLNCNAVFANGSFIPDEFEWDPATTDEPVRTFIDVAAAYDELDMSLEDFDLIYAYPWPTEYSLYLDFLTQYARPDALFLCYDAREGMLLRKVGDA